MSNADGTPQHPRPSSRASDPKNKEQTGQSCQGGTTTTEGTSSHSEPDSSLKQGKNNNNRFPSSRPRRGGGGGGGHQQQHYDRHYSERRKRPDAQHYKPGAFNSKRSDDHDHDQEPTSVPASEDNGSQPSRKEGGRNRGKQKAQSNVDPNVVGGEIRNLSLNDEPSQKSNGKRRNKKPEQPKYVPRKATEEGTTDSQDQVESSVNVGEKPINSNNTKNQSGPGKGKRNRGKKERFFAEEKEVVQEQVPINNMADQKGSDVERPISKTHRQAKDDASHHNGHVEAQGPKEGSENFKQQDRQKANLNQASSQPQEENPHHHHHHPRQRHNEFYPSPRLRDNSQRNDQIEHGAIRGRGGRREQRRGEGARGFGGNNARGGFAPERYQMPTRNEENNNNSSSRGYNMRSPSPRSYHNQRYSQSPSGMRRGTIHQSGRGGRGFGGYRDGGDWGNRYFHEADHRGTGSRWDHRREERGGYRGRGGASNSTVPPRFQKAKEQQQRGDTFVEQEERKEKNNANYHSSYRAQREEDLSGQLRDYRENDSLSPSLSQSSSCAVLATAASNSIADSTRVYSDWSLEVEEEEERLEMRRSSLDREVVASNNQMNPSRHHQPGGGGGIIRLPVSGTSYSDHPKATTSENPALRGFKTGTAQKMASNNQWTGPPHEMKRFLFDPKNPNKPIPAPSVTAGARPPGNNGEPGMISRFQIGPRFPPRMPVGGFAPGTSCYRPPFSLVPPQPPTSFNNQMVGPPRHVAPNTPEWYDIHNPRIYGRDKNHDTSVILKIIHNDMELRRIYGEGGAKMIFNLWNRDVSDCRRNIQEAFEQLLQTNLVFCAEHDVEFHVWKIAFYQIVEALKFSQKEEMPNVRQNIQKKIVELLDEGMEFYAKMLGLLDKTYKLNLESCYDVLEPRPSGKYETCALMSAQKCLLCLGDLARYKENILETSNYGKARQFYQKASNLEPRNGRPFNQLAILASNTKRKFEAVYYNMRCVQSKNPFSSSHESLTVIFEEVKKKWEASERKRLEDRDERKRAVERENETNIITKGTHLRKEIWIRQDGGKRLHRTTSAHEADMDIEDKELRELSATDLNRRFINTYLYLIGKLYTRINMDTFSATLSILQKEFKVLISRTPLPIDSKRLAQIMALNMFVIEHTKMKEGDSENYRSAMQDSALQLAFEMYGILIARCNELLEHFHPIIDSNCQYVFVENDLPALLSAVKVWCDWLLGNNDMWHPVVSEEPFNQLAKLATHLEKMKPQLKPIISQLITEEEYFKQKNIDGQQYELIKLQEDSILCGFTPWFRGLDWSVYRRYIHHTFPATLAQDVRRLDAINFCIEYLEGMENPILKWSLPDNAHICLVENSTTKDKVNARLTNMLASEEYILDESYSGDDEEGRPASGTAPCPGLETEYSGKLAKLKLRKDELERQRLQEEREAKRMQRAILAEHVSVTLEIKPRFLVPDTNCFIDHLADIKRLSNSNQFQLRVPLIVLNELDGLSKGGKVPKYTNKDHAAMVMENARLALIFLRERPNNVKCVTSKGTVVPSLSVTTEEDCEGGKKNDDLILEACSNITEFRMHSQEDEKGNKMRTVYREVVLLTDDRNLKLKSHVTDIPVNKLSDFMKWAYPPSV